MGSNLPKCSRRGADICAQNLLKSGPPPQNDQSRYGKHRVFEPVSTEHCVRTRTSTRVCVSGATVSRGHVRTQRTQPQNCRLYFAATSGVCLIRSGAVGFQKKLTIAKKIKVAKVRGRSNLPKSRRPLTPLVPPGGRRVGAGCGGRAPSRRAGPTGAARHNKTAAEQAGNIKPKLRTVLSLCMSIVTEPCSLSGTAFIRLYRYQLSPVERNNNTPPLSVVCSVLFTVPPRGVL